MAARICAAATRIMDRIAAELTAPARAAIRRGARSGDDEDNDSDNDSDSDYDSDRGLRADGTGPVRPQRFYEIGADICAGQPGAAGRDPGPPEAAGAALRRGGARRAWMVTPAPPKEAAAAAARSAPRLKTAMSWESAVPHACSAAARNRRSRYGCVAAGWPGKAA